MLSEEEKAKLSTELEGKRKEIREIKDKLNDLNRKKEEWFHKKEEVRKKISVLISDVKSSKSERDQFTQTVKLSKTERDVLNKDIKEKSAQLEALMKEREQLEKKYNIQKSPGRVHDEIHKLEKKIETEVMSFEKEKKLMVEIKKLKKQREESGAVNDIWNRIKSLSKDIRDMRRKARTSHQKVQDFAKNSQQKHEALKSTSGEIDTLRKEEEEAFKKFVEFKKEFTEQNNLLKEKLNSIGELSKQLGKDVTELKQVEEQKKKQTLSSMKREVEEKLKTKKKLTTEDLLIMQQG